MITEKPLINSSKIIRTASSTGIHNLFVFTRSGICLYAQNFSACYNMEDNLITSFFTALMSFTKEVIGNKIKTIEMANVKFVLFQKNLFYYGLLCNSIENLILLEHLISKINDLFLDYINKNKINIDCHHINDDQLSQNINTIIKNTLTSEFDLGKEEKIIEFLNDISLNDEIEGIILLTDKGKIVYTSLKKQNFKYFLKEVDFRVKICNNSILKLFYTSKDHELIFSEFVEDLYFIILIFDLDTKFGVAEFYLHKIVNYIKKILNN